MTTLEGLLELPATEINTTLNQAAQLVARALAADKVDIFFHEPADDCLVAVGTSDTPMGRKQQAIGLNRLPLANGGSTVEVFHRAELTEQMRREAVEQGRHHDHVQPLLPVSCARLRQVANRYGGTLWCWRFFSRRSN